MEETSEEVKCEDLEKITLGDDSEKFFQVRAQLPPQKNKELIVFLKSNLDVFAWSAYEALEVNLSSSVIIWTSIHLSPPKSN